MFIVAVPLMAIIPLDGFDFSPTSSYNPQHELCAVNAAPLRSADLACSPSLGLSRARASPQHGSLPTATGLWLDSGEMFPLCLAGFKGYLL